MKLKFKAKLWEWRSKGSWHFITVPKEYWEDIKTITADGRRGFGSVKIEATIGKSTWKTSIFPDTKHRAFVLPVKKEIRSKNNLSDGHSLKVTIEIL